MSPSHRRGSTQVCLLSPMKRKNAEVGGSDIIETRTTIFTSKHLSDTLDVPLRSPILVGRTHLRFTVLLLRVVVTLHSTRTDVGRMKLAEDGFFFFPPCSPPPSHHSHISPRLLSAVTAMRRRPQYVVDPRSKGSLVRERRQNPKWSD